MFRTDAPNIPLEQLQWEDIGDPDIDPKTRLLAHIRIGGLDMHLEALEVKRDHDGDQVAVDPSFDQRLLDLQMIEDTDFQTLELAGRQYVIWATPYGD